MHGIIEFSGRNFISAYLNHNYESTAILPSGCVVNYFFQQSQSVRPGDPSSSEVSISIYGTQDSYYNSRSYRYPEMGEDIGRAYYSYTTKGECTLTIIGKSVNQAFGTIYVNDIKDSSGKPYKIVTHDWE